MKFKYIGQLPIKDGDLVIAGIFKPRDTITNGTIFEVPDENTLLIQRVKGGGAYVEYSEPKKVKRPEKDKQKEEKKEEEKKED